VKLLHVNFADLPGRRFSGYDLLEDLRPYGVDATQVVLTKQSASDRVVGLLRPDGDERLAAALHRMEQQYGMDDLLPPWGRLVAERPEFEAADVVHYHVVHLNMISLLDLPNLFARKPSVWSFHDAWPLTGHCIQPGACDRWMSGCETCPHLDRPLAMSRDCAGRMWELKRQVYAGLDVDVVVASEPMREMVERSPLTRQFAHVHRIPFGIRSERYLDDSEKDASRSKLGIGRDQFVVLFRATDMEHKGVNLLIEALASHPPARPTTLLAIDQKGLLKRLRHAYTVVELGWADDETLARALSACDVFAMPSLAEGFGMMALEAMAAGRPVICFEGTAVSAITHAPEIGLAVPMGDTSALRGAIDTLAADATECRRRGEAGGGLAREEYAHQRYLESLVALYKSAATRERACAETAPTAD
jgi:glycosyltransferase involved in cell wall biosynthesis